MILDVSNDILNKLISFNNQLKFFDKIFCECSGEIMV